MEQVENFQIRKTFIEEQTEYLASQATDNLDEAFEFLVTSLIFDIEPEEIDAQDMIGGSQDKQMDVIRITDKEDEGSAEIEIIQAKNVNGFSSDICIKIRNGLKWMFEIPKSEYSTLKNQDLVNKIKELRELRSKYGPSNLNVFVYFVTKGNTGELSEEYLQERKILVEKYSSVGFGKFEYKEVGSIELVDYIDEQDRLKKQVDIRLPIQYDVNKPSVLKYISGETEALICTVLGSDLAKVTNQEPKDAIFDMNVRPFYGTKGKVNSDIYSTCTGKDSYRFWFLNNGVTMVCDEFDLIQDPDKTEVKIINAQIVNGCQTTVTIREAFNSQELKADVRVLLRVYSTDNPKLVEKITLTTNNQNKITSRDLRANDKVQRDVQRLMEEKFEFKYERKNKEFSKVRGIARQKVVPNTKAAQAYLAIVRKKPSNARGYLGAIWSDFYKEIFTNATVSDLLATYLIYKYCNEMAMKARKFSELTRDELDVRVYGSFHIARVIGYFITNDRWGKNNLQFIDDLIPKLVDKSKMTEELYISAQNLVLSIRNSENEENKTVPALYFKTKRLQNSINQKLNSQPESREGE